MTLKSLLAILQILLVRSSSIPVTEVPLPRMSVMLEVRQVFMQSLVSRDSLYQAEFMTESAVSGVMTQAEV